jgi:hypothetical protein
METPEWLEGEKFKKMIAERNPNYPLPEEE